MKLKYEGGVIGRPETMFPRTNFLGPLVPKMNRPGDTIPRIDTSLSCMLYTCTNILHCIMHNNRAVSTWGPCVSGTIRFGDQESQKNRKGTHHFRSSRQPANMNLFFFKNTASNHEYKIQTFIKSVK